MSLSRPTRVCFLGLDALPSLSRCYSHLGVAAGEPVQQSLLARALAARGYDVTLVVLDQGQPDGLIVGGVRTINAYKPERGARVIRYFHPRWSGVLRALESAEADVYYTSCAGINVAQIVQAARRVGGGTIFRVASDSDCQPGRLLMPWHGRDVYRWGLRHVGRILVQTRQQQADMRTNYRRESTLARMLLETGRGDRTFGDRDCDALWVANLRPLKRPDRMLSLARALPGLRFRMVGGTQPGAERLFYEVGREAGGIPNLEFAGPVPYHDVGGMFESARLLVNTSEIEGFPNTYLQAWARGVPVVTFLDPDGVIAREQLGRVVANEDEMRRAVAELSSDEGGWQAVSARCRAYVEREFGEETVMAAYLLAIEGATALK